MRSAAGLTSTIVPSASRTTTPSCIPSTTCRSLGDGHGGIAGMRPEEGGRRAHRFLSAASGPALPASYRAPVPDTPPARAILLTGTMGSGKTVVTIAIGELWSGASSPTRSSTSTGWAGSTRAGLVLTQRSVLAENLRLIWPTFREAGVERLVLARYVEDRAQLDAFRAALPGVQLAVVRLVASPGGDRAAPAGPRHGRAAGRAPRRDGASSPPAARPTPSRTRSSRTATARSRTWRPRC